MIIGVIVEAVIPTGDGEPVQFNHFPIMSMGAFCCHGNQTKRQTAKLFTILNTPYPSHTIQATITGWSQRLVKKKQEAHGPQLAHQSETATTNIHLLFFFSILSLQLMKGSSVKQFLELKKNNVFFTHSSSSNYYCLVEGLVNAF